LKVYDTLSGEKKNFIPKDTVRIFLCGPTVYDQLHLGHARMLLFYDMVARYMCSLGCEPKVILNITDIDPKIFARARSEKRSPQRVATFYIDELLHDMKSLGVDNFFVLARVSDHVELARQLVKRLLDDKRAYSAGGKVFLDTKRIPNFGRLSKMTRQDLSDSRLDIAQGKRSPFDILLWNAVENFDINFSDCTLGDGIPWWHMQDTSVAIATFGGKYEIHGGANELIYPHHESHLAQLSELVSDDMPVKIWTHIGLVYIKGRKMSKSIGNTITIKDILKIFNPNVLRLFFYSTGYRKRLDFSKSKMEGYAKLDKIIGASAQREKEEEEKEVAQRYYFRKFMQRLGDDFDTEGAIKVMIQAAKSGVGTRAMVEILGLRY
jgi:cysteinyl-tRNA synthetase